MLATTHCAPNRVAHSVINVGRRTAAEFTLTLSAPARNAAAMSSTLRMPPPIVRGIDNRAAARSAVPHVEARDHAPHETHSASNETAPLVLNTAPVSSAA